MFKIKTNFDMLKPLKILVCPNCDFFLFKDESDIILYCFNCGKKINEDDAKAIVIHKVHEGIKEVWESNLWFEAYMARLLENLGWKTWTSVYIMGALGIRHEIDVLAIKDGTVLVAECKIGKVTRNGVFNFYTKVGDSKAHLSILALVKELPEPET